MTMSYETSARSLEQKEIDVINYSDVHRHDPNKIISFTAEHQGSTVHPSMASRHRRAQHRAVRQQKWMVTYPRYLSVALLILFVYLQLAGFSEVPATGLNVLWIGAYALAGISFLFARLFHTV